MSEQDTWTQNRRRLVKCKQHGLHFDPGLTSGCAICRREGYSREQDIRSSRLGFLIPLLVVTLLAALAYRAWDQRRRATAPEGETAAVSARAAARLVPEDFQASLHSLDTAVFHAPGNDFSAIGDQIAAAARALGGELERRGPRLAQPLVRELGLLADSVTSADIALADLQRARTTWTRLRSTYFQQAPWPTAPTGEGEDRALLLVYQDVLDEIVDLANEGNAQASAAGDSDEAWRSFSQDWQLRISSLVNRIPQRPRGDANPSFLVAVQHMETALNRLRNLAADSQLPSSEFDARFEPVFSAARDAQAALRDLL